jgi:hypothetical protein
MGKYISMAAIATAATLVFWSKPTVPATHGYAQHVPATSTAIRASDRLVERAAAEEARAAAAQRLARHDRPTAFGQGVVR